MSRRKKPRYVPFAGGVIDEESKDKKEDTKKDEVVKEVKKEEKKVEKKKEKKEEKKEKKKEEKKIKQIEPKKEVQVAKKIDEINTFTWQMEKFQIMLADGEDIMVAIMLDSEPSEPIKTSLIEFTKEFEKTYKKEIKGFAGDVNVFKPAQELANKTFNLFLMQPQMFPYDPAILDNAGLTSIERKIYNNAREIAEERGFFFIATLMEQFVKGTKVDQEKLIKAIFSLHEKGVFRSIPIEKISEESEKHLLMKRLPANVNLDFDDRMEILNELINSTEESREHFFKVLPTLPKKNMALQMKREMDKRRKIRENRDLLFAKLDEYINQDEYENAVMILNQVANLSLQIGENTVAQEFQDRAQMFQQAAEQMRQRIPLLRDERNRLLNQGEAFEVEGNYDGAVDCYEKAGQISHEISDFDMAKKCEQAIERIKSLKELAKLRESLR